MPVTNGPHGAEDVTRHVPGTHGGQVRTALAACWALTGARTPPQAGNHGRDPEAAAL